MGGGADSRRRRCGVRPMNPTEREHREELPLMILGAPLLLVSPFALVAGAVLEVLSRGRRGKLLPLLLVGAVAAAVTARPYVDQMRMAGAEVNRFGLAIDPEGAWHAAWPHLWRAWLLALPIAPLVALLVRLVRPQAVEEKTLAAERKKERSVDRATRRARRRAKRTANKADGQLVKRKREPMIELGAQATGDAIFSQRRGAVLFPVEWLRRHALVLGSSGSGKTETLLRLAYGTALAGWRVYYLDAKGDPHGAVRFRGVMQAARIDPLVFPDRGFDAFRGDTRAVYNRLLELVAYSTEGDGAYYRDVAKKTLWLACNDPEGPPRSSAELLARLTPAELRRLAGSAGALRLEALGAREIASVSLRYEAFFNALDGRLDEGFSWEDTRAGYLLLDGLALKEEAQSLARLLVEDFADYVARRKHPEEPALLIVDEVSAVSGGARLVDLVERVRSFNVGVVLAPQVEQGIGPDDAAERVVQNVETVFLHSLKRPESIAELAGTRREVESSLQHDRGNVTGWGTGREQHVFKVDPNQVRALGPGECFVIRRGKAVRVAIARAPERPIEAVRSETVQPPRSAAEPAQAKTEPPRL